MISDQVVSSTNRPSLMIDRTNDKEKQINRNQDNLPTNEVRIEEITKPMDGLVLSSIHTSMDDPVLINRFSQMNMKIKEQDATKGNEDQELNINIMESIYHDTHHSDIEENSQQIKDDTTNYMIHVVTSPPGGTIFTKQQQQEHQQKREEFFSNVPPSPIVSKSPTGSASTDSEFPSVPIHPFIQYDKTVPRESIMGYRPSDMTASDALLSRRDSLLDVKRDSTGRPTDGLLADIDENYRMSAATKEKMTAQLSPLLKAAKAGNVAELVSLLNQPSTDILRRDPIHGQSALHFAVRGGHINVISALCRKDIVESIINVPDNRRNTALHLSVAKSRRITKLLLDNGASVALSNLRNQTPLGIHILTAKRDDPIMAEMLLQYHSDPNAILNQSNLLHVAVDNGLIEIACRLVRHGARLDIKDENMKMVFDKLDRKTLRRLLNKISYPPVWVPNNEKSDCMLCEKKFSKLGIGIRKHHCRHCGRLVCGECSHLRVECVKFPPTFHDRLKAGAKANHEEKRVCRTCYNIFKERYATINDDEERKSTDLEKQVKNFYESVVKYKYEEVKGQTNAPRHDI